MADEKTPSQRGRSSRRKGAVVERAIVELHHSAGIPAEKVSRTGHTGPDLKIADEFTGEVKARKSSAGFVTLNRWLGGNDLLFLRSQGKTQPTVVMPWEVYKELLRGYLRHQDKPIGIFYKEFLKGHQEDETRAGSDLYIE